MQTEANKKENFDRKELRQKLRHGDIGRISDITGTHRSKIQRYFLNKTDDPRIDKCVKALVEKYEVEFEQSLNEALE